MTAAAREDRPFPAVAGAPARTGGKTSFDAWLTLALLFVFCLLANFDQRIIIMMVEPIKRDLALTDMQMAWLLGPAFAVAFAVFQLPLGWASDRFPRRWVIFLGVSAWSVATMACAFTNTFWTLLIARAFVGVGEASLNPAAYSLIGDKFPRHRLFLALSIYSFALKVSTAIALGLGGVLIAVAVGIPVDKLPLLAAMSPWQIVFIIVGGGGMLIAWLALLIREPPRAKPATRQEAELAGEERFLPYLRRNAPLIVTIAVAFGLIYMTVGALLSWVPTYMTRHHGWQPIQYGPVMGLMSVLSIGIMFAKGLAVDWFFMRGWKDIYVRFYTWLLLGSLPLLPIAFIQQSPLVFLVIFGVVQSVALGAPMFLAAISQSICPMYLRGRISAALLLFSGLMMGVGPLMPAMLTDFVFRDEARIGSAMCIVAVVALTVSLVLFRTSLRWMRLAVERYVPAAAAAQ